MFVEFIQWCTTIRMVDTHYELNKSIEKIYKQNIFYKFTRNRDVTYLLYELEAVVKHEMVRIRHCIRAWYHLLQMSQKWSNL